MFFGLVHVRRPACSVLSGLLDGSARMREGAVLSRPPAPACSCGIRASLGPRPTHHGAGLQGFLASVRSREGPAESAFNLSSAGNSFTVRKDGQRGSSRLVCTCPLLSQSTLLETFC